jgi:hypothetical protein
MSLALSHSPLDTGPASEGGHGGAAVGEVRRAEWRRVGHGTWWHVGQTKAAQRAEVKRREVAGSSQRAAGCGGRRELAEAKARGGRRVAHSGRRVAQASRSGAAGGGLQQARGVQAAARRQRPRL